MLFLFFIASLLFFVVSSNLLLSLILLEILGFTTLFICVSAQLNLVSPHLVVFLFSILVMEGVIALAGLITLVSSTGSDSLSSSSLLKC
jgi:formate hydrogenlyase subunit 3/multisubunit Na+/H+ antiporter MnhD subunit